MPDTPLLAADLVLTGLDPGRSKIVLGAHPDVLVEAAIIIDLVRAGRVTVGGTGLDTRVVVADPTPLEQPVLREALQWLQDVHGSPTAADLAELDAAGWFTRTVVGLVWDPTKPGVKLSKALSGHYARRRLLEHLVSSGTLTVSEHRVLGLKRTQRYAAASLARRDELVDELRAVLVDGREPNERTGPLLGLLGAANLFASTLNGAAHLARWVPRTQRREVQERAQQLAETDWDAGGVRATIAGAEAVIDKRNETSG